jgi:hypothetical protein
VVTESDLYVRRVALITFTSAERNFEWSLGRMRRFWHAVDEEWGYQEYFWWLELQEDGTPHYHVMWLNPPQLRHGLNEKWLRANWGADITHWRFKDASWWARKPVEYVLGYAKKMGDKAYQQDYEDVPRALRTFGMQRLGVRPEEWGMHEDRWDAAYVREKWDGEEYTEEHLELAGVRRHVAPHGCSLGAVIRMRRPNRKSRGRLARAQARGAHLGERRPAARGPGRTRAPGAHLGERRPAARGPDVRKPGSLPWRQGQEIPATPPIKEAREAKAVATGDRPALQRYKAEEDLPVYLTGDPWWSLAEIEWLPGSVFQLVGPFPDRLRLEVSSEHEDWVQRVESLPW